MHVWRPGDWDAIATRLKTETSRDDPTLGDTVWVQEAPGAVPIRTSNRVADRHVMPAHRPRVLSRRFGEYIDKAHRVVENGMLT